LVGVGLTVLTKTQLRPQCNFQLTVKSTRQLQIHLCLGQQFNGKPPPDLGGTLKGNIMGNEKKTPLSIDGVEYQFEDLTQEQQMLVNHVADLDRKLASAKFNVDQLQVGRNAFFELLKQALAAKPEEAVSDVEPK
jgi:hypothetical protein